MGKVVVVTNTLPIFLIEYFLSQPLSLTVVNKSIFYFFLSCNANIFFLLLFQLCSIIFPILSTFILSVYTLLKFTGCTPLAQMSNEKTVCAHIVLDLVNRLPTFTVRFFL